MSVQLGQPGNSARWTSYVQLIGVPLVLLFTWVLFAPLVLWTMRSMSPLARVLAFLLGSGIVVVFMRKDVSWVYFELKKGLNYRKGADGEVRASEALSSLPDDYVVIHDFHPIAANGEPSDWNVDHIVVGPNGIFVLDTKNYAQPLVRPAAKSTFTQKNVKQAQRNAAGLKKKFLLWSGGALDDAFVVPMVVYVHPDAFVERMREDFVRVIPLKYLVGDIVKQRTRRPLDPSEVQKVATVLFSQMAPHLQEAYRPEFRRFGSGVQEWRRQRYEESKRLVEKTAPPEPEVDEVVASIDSMVCPICGAELLRRVARHGARAGKPFLGCSNYGSTGCRYLVNLDE